MRQIQKKIKKWLSPITAELPRFYLVGGAVRDHFMNRPVQDIDLACEAPERMAGLLQQHHNATIVRFDKKPHAVCYRVVDRNRKEETLDIVQIKDNDIEADLRERDFTVNAIALEIDRHGQIQRAIDPVGGLSDIKNNIIRVASPRAFRSDPLRILRAFRFSAEMHFTLEDSTGNQAADHAHLLSGVAMERIMSEWLKLLAADSTANQIRRMDQAGLLAILFPETIKMKGCRQNAYHHLDVWGHALLALEQCEQILLHLDQYFPETASRIQPVLEQENRKALLKMAALFHDIGKPDTQGQGARQTDITFYRHEQVGREIISRIAKRIKLSAQNRNFLESLVEGHLQALFLSRPEVTPQGVRRWFRKTGENAVPLIILSIADCKSILGVASHKSERDHHIAWAARIVNAYFTEIKPQLTSKSLVNGKDLITLGMLPGPALGRVLALLREAQDDGTIQNRPEGLALAKTLWETTTRSNQE